MGGGCGWSSIELTRWWPFLVLGEEGPAQGERGCNGGSSLWASLNNGALLSGDSGFLYKHSYLYSSSLTPSPQDVSSQPTAVLCLGLLSRPHISAPSLCLQQWTLSGWVGRAGISTLRTGLTLSCCQDCCRVLFLQRMRLPFCLS